MKVRVLQSLATVMAFSTALLGCSSSTATNDQETGSAPPAAAPAAEKPEAEATAPEPVTINYTFWAGSQASVDIVNKVIELFEEKHPHINVEYEYAPWGNYWDKLSVQAASNSLPDVVRQDYSYLERYSQKNVLLSLDELVSQNKIDLSTVDKKFIESGYVNGKLYGISSGSNANVLLYDPEQFDKAGVPKPKDNWTWEEYEQTVTALKEKLGVYGDMHMDANQFRVYLRQFGASLFSKDGKSLGYDDDKLFVDFYGRQIRLQEAGIISPIESELESKGSEDTPFAKFETVMGSRGYWSNNLEGLQTFMKKPLEIAMIPGDAKGMYLKASTFYSISASSKHPEEAALFINFIMNDIDANKIINGSSGFPYVPAVLEALQPNFNDAQKKVAAYLESVAKYADPIFPPEPEKSGEVNKVLSNLESEMFFGRITPEEAAVKFREQANSILGN